MCLSAWVTSIVVGVNLSLGPVTGALLNKCGFRITSTAGCLSCSAGLVMGSFVPSIITLYIAFSLPFAVGQSLIFVSAAIIVNHYFDKRRSLAFGVVTAGQGLGTMILGPALQALVDGFDWRNTFRVFAGLLALASFTQWFLHRGTSSPDENEKATSKKFTLNLWLLKDPAIMVLMITTGLYQFSRLVPYVHLVSILIVSTTKCSIVIGSPRAYFPPNQKYNKILESDWLSNRAGDAYLCDWTVRASCLCNSANCNNNLFYFVYRSFKIITIWKVALEWFPIFMHLARLKTNSLKYLTVTFSQFFL